jgi:hypothetical protein
VAKRLDLVAVFPMAESKPGLVGHAVLTLARSDERRKFQPDRQRPQRDCWGAFPQRFNHTLRNKQSIPANE